MTDFIPIAAPPQSTAPVSFDVPATEQKLRSFQEMSRARVAALPHTAPAPNTVVVQPGGKVYNSISAAIAGTTPDPQAWPVLYVGPGTYYEQVIMKPYINIQGSGSGVTFIAWTGPEDQHAKGTVVAASNASIGDCTIQALGKGWGTWATALDCGGAVPFAMSNCNLEALDQGQPGINMMTIAIDYGAQNPGNSQLYISDCNVHCEATADNYPIAMLGYGGAFAQAISAKFVASSPNGWGWGVASALYSNIQLDDSVISGSSWSLTINQPPATLIATHCQTIGPVGPGVVIVP